MAQWYRVFWTLSQEVRVLFGGAYNSRGFFQKFTVLCFLGNKKSCHCTRQSSDIQWITDINTCPGQFLWLVCYNRIFIHLYFHSFFYFTHLYLMPLAVTEMKRINHTMLRYQLATTVFCTEYDLKPSIKTCNFSFKIVLRFLFGSNPPPNSSKLAIDSLRCSRPTHSSKPFVWSVALYRRFRASATFC